MKKNLTIAALMLFALTVSTAANACTDFQIKTKDGSVIIGRSMEFGPQLNSNLVVHPRAEDRLSHTPSGSAGLKWKSKYGYLAADGFGMPIVIDGMNEKGLSAGFLWLPGAKYQDVTSRDSAVALEAVDIGSWVLGNFATVDEVKKAFANVRVWEGVLPQLGMIPPAHLAVHDALGNNLVIEWINGETKIYDNPAGVLTNAPEFPWHTTNIKNYIQLKAGNPEPVTLEGMVLAPPGQGSGLLGIPGDWTPPSRFVRTTAMLAFAEQVDNADKGTNLAEHILNAVDIPLGAVRAKQGQLQDADYTQWIVIKDLSNGKFYFRTYDNMALRSIDLKKLHFDIGSKVETIPMAGGKDIADLSDKLQ